MDNDPDQLPFYNDEDMRAVSSNGFRWGFFAGFVCLAIAMGSILLVGYLTGY